jgi:hypothetical protein
MNADEFARVRTKIMAQGYPSSGLDLRGMLEDFHHALDQSEILALLWVKKTGQPEQMIDARCEPAVDTVTIDVVAAEIERIWREDLRYSSFEAHALFRHDYDVSLDFVTSSGPGSFYVTGRIAVDTRRIQGQIKAVTFWYRLAGKGWSEAGIFDGVEQALLTASYLSDGLTELVDAVNALLQGREESRCAWQEEPGEYRWIFARRGDHLKIDIRWFGDTFSTESDERGQPVFSSECSLLRFAMQLRDQLATLIEEHGADGYQRQWGMPFPREEYRRLQELLAERGGKNPS